MQLKLVSSSCIAKINILHQYTLIEQSPIQLSLILYSANVWWGKTSVYIIHLCHRSSGMLKLIQLEGHYITWEQTETNWRYFQQNFICTCTHRHLRCNLSIISYHHIIHQISAVVSEGQLNKHCSVHPPQVSVVGACTANNKCFTLQRVWLCKTTSHCASFKLRVYTWKESS